MSLESTQNPLIAELEDLTTQEIAGILLPVLTAGEAILDADVETIKRRAKMLIEANSDLSLDEALLNAAGERFEARKNLTGDHVAVIDQADGVVYSVSEASGSQDVRNALRSVERE